MPQAGETLELSFKAHDGATGLYVEARLFDGADQELPGSPVELEHVADGLYTNSDLTMPTTETINVSIVPWETAAKIDKSTLHTELHQKFKLEIPFQVYLDKFQELCDKLEILLQNELLANLVARLEVDHKPVARLSTESKFSARLDTENLIKANVVDLEKFKSSVEGKQIHAALKGC